MINSRFRFLAGLFALTVAVSALAEPTNEVSAPPVAPVSKPKMEEYGKLGDPAPPIRVQAWVKGEPVRLDPGTNIYALVFCTLSRANEFALTNLSALQKLYRNKGVKVIIVSDDSPEVLKAYVQEKGDEIDFTVAADALGRATIADYQRMYRQIQLPRAYIVGTNATVLWHGHPLRDDLGMVLGDVAAGRYDIERTRLRVAQKEQMDQYMIFARQDDPKTQAAGRILLTLRTNDAPALCDLAFRIATDPYIQTRDEALATTALDRAEQLSNTNAVDIAVDRAILLFQTGKQEAGLAKAKETLAMAKTEEDKREVNTMIHAMETRLAQSASQTNQPTQKP